MVGILFVVFIGVPYWSSELNDGARPHYCITVSSSWSLMMSSCLVDHFVCCFSVILDWLSHNLKIFGPMPKHVLRMKGSTVECACLIYSLLACFTWSCLLPVWGQQSFLPSSSLLSVLFSNFIYAHTKTLPLQPLHCSVHVSFPLILLLYPNNPSKVSSLFYQG